MEVGPQMREGTESWKGGCVSLKLLKLSFSRLKVDENAPSLPSRSLKRGRGRGFPTLSSREESNSVSIHRGRGGSRSREKSEKEGKVLVKADLVTKQKSRFRPRTSGSSLVANRQRTNNQLNLVSAGESEETIVPEKPVRAEKVKKSR